MTSPIFFPAFFKKYMVQTKRNQEVWKNHNAYRHMDEAEREARRLMRHKPDLPVRIMNQLTKKVVKHYSGQSRK